VIEAIPKNTETVTENWGISVSIRAFVPAAKSRENMKRPTIYPDSAGTRTNRLPKCEIGILLTE
jgi:hypothetical protein